MKMHYKKHNNFCARTLQARIRDAIKSTLTVDAARLCARRAAEYQRAYIDLDSAFEGSDLGMPDIERVKKQHKSHRAALDFDRGWARALLNSTARSASAV